MPVHRTVVSKTRVLRQNRQWPIMALAPSSEAEQPDPLDGIRTRTFRFSRPVLCPVELRGARAVTSFPPFPKALLVAVRYLVACIQLTTDAHKMYATAVERAFGWGRVDYAQVEKLYGQAPEGRRRYSPPVCLGCRKRHVMGNPDPDMVSTSHVERSNLSMRTSSRRYTRLTNAFSKSVDFHRFATSLHVMYYNFVKVHGTLTKERGGIKTTPAMAAGLATRPWTVYDLLELLQGK